MPRLLDLFAIIAVAVVVLLPKASVEARPALDGEPIELDRVSKLQDDVLRHPDEVQPALELADAFLSFARSDWAIATLAPLVEREQRGAMPKDARVHLLMATARAERLEAAETVAEAARIDEACSGGEGPPTCPPGTLARAHFISGSMKTLLDQNIDPATDPQRAKDAVYKVLHPSHSSFGPHGAGPH